MSKIWRIKKPDLTKESADADQSEHLCVPEGLLAVAGPFLGTPIRLRLKDSLTTGRLAGIRKYATLRIFAIMLTTGFCEAAARTH
ncbi:hypothetical protein [Paraburkholderia kururiensis]|uniref:hypothetical protein n=1 Tax=Paraburkholderia kururiensis TaxID=984307 RepID=UPI00159039AE|nr:hypothetical protein [Paraburkholderia kururiensis]